MNKGHKKLLIISLVLSVIMVINAVMQIFALYTYALFLLVVFFIVKKIMGMEDDHFPNKKEILIIIIGSIMFYYTITYVTVFFWGALENIFTLTVANFFSIVLPMMIIIALNELIRYIIVRKGRRYPSIWVVSVILFTLMEVTVKIQGYDFNVPIEIIKFYLEVVLVILAKNIFLCYLTNKVGYKPAIVYHFLMDIPLYFLPLFPNLEVFIDSIVKSMFPMLLMAGLIFYYKKLNVKDEITTERQRSRIKKTCATVIIICLVVMAGLYSTKFPVFTVVIGSSSMSPNMEKGDIAFIVKVKDKDTIKKNDILVFTYNDTTVIHRVSRIRNNAGGRIFYTKGDANKEEDYYPVEEEDVIGIAKFKIKYLGYPTIWLSEKVK